MGVNMKAEIKKFEQTGSLTQRVAYTIDTMRAAGCTDAEIQAALSALCTADIDAEIEELEWQR